MSVISVGVRSKPKSPSPSAREYLHKVSRGGVSKHEKQSLYTGGSKYAFACNAGVGNLLNSSHVVAFGDVHGDIEALKACLRISGVTNEDGSWIAPRGTAVIILGDVVDRYRENFDRRIQADLLANSVDPVTGLTKSLGEIPGEEMLVLRTINDLSMQARRNGSVVMRLVGNHEVAQSQNITVLKNPPSRVQEIGDYAYQKLYASQTALGGSDPAKFQERYESFHNPMGEFHRAVGECSPKAIIQVGSHIFLHGGLTAEHVNAATDLARSGNRKNFIDLANDMFSDYWNNAGAGYTADQFLYIVEGMLYNKQLADDNVTEAACSLRSQQAIAALNANLQEFSPGWPEVKRIVVSHCPQWLRPETNLGYLPARLNPTPPIAGVEEYTTRGVPPGMPRFMLTPLDNKTINCVCEAKVWRVDVNMSRAFTFARATYRIKGIHPNEELKYKRAMRPAVLIIDDDGGEYSVRQTTDNLPLV